MSVEVVPEPEGLILGMRRRVFAVRVSILLAAVLAVFLPWAWVEGVLRSEGYPDRATFEWFPVTHATKRVVLAHVGAPSLRLRDRMVM